MHMGLPGAAVVRDYSDTTAEEYIKNDVVLGAFIIE
jgi:hypothetical protein